MNGQAKKRGRTQKSNAPFATPLGQAGPAPRIVGARHKSMRMQCLSECLARRLRSPIRTRQQFLVAYLLPHAEAVSKEPLSLPYQQHLGCGSEVAGGGFLAGAASVSRSDWRASVYRSIFDLNTKHLVFPSNLHRWHPRAGVLSLGWIGCRTAQGRARPADVCQRHHWTGAFKTDEVKSRH